MAEHEAALTLLLSIAPETVREAAWPTAQALLKRHIEDKARIAQGRVCAPRWLASRKRAKARRRSCGCETSWPQASGQHIASQDELEIFLEAQRTCQEELSSSRQRPISAAPASSIRVLSWVAISRS